MKIGLCIGHSRYIAGKRDGGAVMTLPSGAKMNEWTFNTGVAALAAKALFDRGHTVKIYDRYEGNGYTKSMIWIGEKMKADGIQVAAEMHFNFFDNENNDKGHGHEWLYWHTSTKGKILAQCFFDAEKRIIPAVVPRSILPRKEGRGAAFLENTYCPTVVAEPFFGDDDADKITPEKVAAVYVDGFVCYASKVG